MLVSSETAVCIAGPGGRLAATLHAPATPGGLPVVCAHAVFEERKAAQRPLVELARSLCARGHAVLRFDYAGCGDSEGDFDTCTVGSWQADLAAAIAWTRAETGAARVGLLGVRVGAALALASAASRDDVAWLALWEPVVSGAAYLDHELRRKLMKEMLTFGSSRGSRAALADELAAGRTVDLDGYPLTPALHAALVALDATRALPPAPCPVLIAHATPAATAAEPIEQLDAALRAAGLATTLAILALPPFWSLVGLADTAPLQARTLAWLEELAPP